MNKQSLLLLSFLAVGLAAKAQNALPKSNPEVLPTSPLLQPKIKPFSSLPYNADLLKQLNALKVNPDSLNNAASEVTISPIDHMPVLAIKTAYRMPTLKPFITDRMPIVPDGITEPAKEKVKP